MAKRNKLEEEFVDAIIKLSSIGLFIIGYFLTKSLITELILGEFGLFMSFILLIIRKNLRESKLKNAKIDDIDRMYGVQFENYLKLLFRERGYKVELTKSTGDFGADLILSANNKKIVVQAKRYSQYVGIKAVQEIVSAIAHYKANEGWVVTNSYFTNAAVTLAKSNGIKLIDREQLLKMIENVGWKKQDAFVKVSQKIKPVEYCKWCGSELVLRKGPKGNFYGCSRFPKCRYTKNVKSV